MTEKQRSYLSYMFQTRINPEMILVLTQIASRLMYYSQHTTMNLMPPSLAIFLTQLCHDSQISPAVLFVAALYMKRLKHRLPPESAGLLL